MSKETFIEPHKSRELEPMIILEGSMAADMQALCWRKSREYTSLSLRQKRANCSWQGVETSKSPRPVTCLLQQGHIRIRPKQFHQVEAKPSNTGPYEDHSYSNYHRLTISETEPITGRKGQQQTAREEAQKPHFEVRTKSRHEVGTGHKLSNPSLRDKLPPAKLCFLKVP